jgi:nitroreductase
MKEFLAPVFNVYLGRAANLAGAEGKDWFLYDAPLLLYFYGTAYADAPDPVIAATYAMLAGQALGLGSCMLGIPGVLFQYDRRLRAAYHLPERLKPGVAVAFGYPAVRYQRALRRRFARVERI